MSRAPQENNLLPFDELVRRHPRRHGLDVGGERVAIVAAKRRPSEGPVGVVSSGGNMSLAPEPVVAATGSLGVSGRTPRREKPEPAIGPPRTGVAVHRLRSVSDVVDAFTNLDRSTSSELLEIVPSGADAEAVLSRCRERDVEALNRGVGCFVIVEAVRESTVGLRSEIDIRRAAGARVRVTNRPAPWFRLFDRAAAVLPAPVGPASPNSLIVYERTVLGSLHALFARVWAQASEPAADATAERSSLRERQVLRLLNMGVTDEVAARRMDVSVRTYRRYVADLMERLGADSRFQAGALAAERGWL